MRISIYHMLLIAVFLSISTSCKKRKYEKAGISKIKDFGSNPGNLKLFYYEPDNATSGMPLVVVLHGCNQNALSVAELSDWNKLGEEYGFYVLYPEQKKVNNVSSCFNWFRDKDVGLGKGETATIANMVTKMINDFEIDQDKVFITGMSAGAGMTMALVSCYPELFNGGAVLAGGPFGISGTKEGSQAILGKVDKSPDEWGDLVRNARDNNIQSWEYPSLVIMHGKNDQVVDFRNANEILEQWSNVTNVSISNPQNFNHTSDVLLKTFTNNSGLERIWLYEINDLGHELPTDPGDGATQGGGSGVFAKDKDFFSSYWIAKHWGLIP